MRRVCLTDGGLKGECGCLYARPLLSWSIAQLPTSEQG